MLRRRLLAFVLSVATVLGVVSIPATSAWASSTAEAITFADVPPGAPFYRQVSWVASQGISTGYLQPDGSRLFKPNESIARDAMAAFLYRSQGSPAFTAPSTSPFTDVPTSYPFYKEITWLVSRGITTGWDAPGGKKEFRPTASIGRDAMAAFLYRDAGRPPFAAPSTSPFTDVPTSYPFYKEIAWLARRGITMGYDNGDGSRSYRPADPVARNAMAAFLYRYAGTPRYVPPGAIAGATSVTQAYKMTFAILDGGRVWGWGSSAFGELGLPGAVSAARPRPILGITDVRSVSVAQGDLVLGDTVTENTVYAIRADGTVWAWGSNANGQLGNGTRADSSTPVQVSGLSGVKAVVGHSESAFALRNDGTVWAWGRNNRGQLGNGSTTGSTTPVQVASLTGITAIGTDRMTAWAVDAQGAAWVWGSNDAGFLGDGTKTASSAPRKLTGLGAVTQLSLGRALKNDGTVWMWGGGQASVPTQVAGLSSVTQLIDFFALRSDGTVWGLPGNRLLSATGCSYGNSSVPVQLPGLTGITQIAQDANSNQGVALRNDGTVWSWGLDYQYYPRDVSLGGSCTPQEVPGPFGIIRISGSTALDRDGAVWTWGDNSWGQLGTRNGVRYSAEGEMATI